MIAKDVKLQLDFEPAAVESWRLVGYENRAIADKDFRNDKVDAGEMGAGHSVTAVYELKLRADAKGRLATVRARWKAPDAKKEDAALEAEFPLETRAVLSSVSAASDDFRFAAAVVGFAEVLRGSPEADGWTLARVLETAAGSATSAEREELLVLVQKVQSILRGQR